MSIFKRKRGGVEFFLPDGFLFSESGLTYPVYGEPTTVFRDGEPTDVYFHPRPGGEQISIKASNIFGFCRNDAQERL